MSNPDLARLYFDYALAQQRMLATPSPQRSPFEQQRDRYWSDYQNAGGSLPPLEGHDASHAIFETIAQGERSERVKELQLLLGLPKDSQEGAFGRTTRRWVEDFQGRHNLTVTGSVDATTWGMLREASQGAPTGSPSSDRDVSSGSSLQFALRRPDYSTMLALDLTSQRTYCNTFNLALFARLVYADDKPKNEDSTEKEEKPAETEARNARCPLDDLVAQVNEGSFEMLPLVLNDRTAWRPLLRGTDPGHEYKVRALSSSQADGSPKPGAASPDPDGGKDEMVVIDSQGTIWRGSNHMIVALRGTQQLPPDVLTDVTAGKVRWPYGPGFVCRGFLAAFELTRDALDYEL